MEDKSFIFVGLFVYVVVLLRDGSCLVLLYCLMQYGHACAVVPMSYVYRSIQNRCKLILLLLFLLLFITLSFLLRINIGQEYSQSFILSTLAITP